MNILYYYAISIQGRFLLWSNFRNAASASQTSGTNALTTYGENNQFIDPSSYM